MGSMKVRRMLMTVVRTDDFYDAADGGDGDGGEKKAMEKTARRRSKEKTSFGRKSCKPEGKTGKWMVDV
ncbi:unnamed protein product [Protopolystoma xenopodis]|uniref:Uncharacterized protein n=1 Tax=Protopolystoma xenopodis TaxID=117903 RepID=A0A3S5AGH1_9PLAT|nr:unnamed protein product [Protopolystoma xenopodis]